ncbi:MAG: NADH-quinone oxidoreductase subunit A, partial [Planctomycetaceae bacterium]
HPVDPVLVPGYVALFVAIGGAILAVNLLVGWLVRPRAPNVEKLEVYECGEPTIGSSFVQFDLRFYVVALLFIIFDVEVALFFPWATVFGKAVQLSDPALVTVQADGAELLPAAAGLMKELGVSRPAVPAIAPSDAAKNAAISTTAVRAKSDPARDTAHSASACGMLLSPRVASRRLFTASDGTIVDFARLPVEVAWGRSSLNPTAVAASKVIVEPVHGGPNQ